MNLERFLGRVRSERQPALRLGGIAHLNVLAGDDRQKTPSGGFFGRAKAPAVAARAAGLADSGSAVCRHEWLRETQSAASSAFCASFCFANVDSRFRMIGTSAKSPLKRR